VVFFTLLAVFLYIEGRRNWAYAVVAFAALIKMYPGFVLLLFLAFDFMRYKGDHRKLAVGVLLIAAIAVACTLPFMILGADLSHMFEVISLHSKRGFQVESTVAVIVQFLGDHGIGTYSLVEMSHTYDVVSPLTNVLSPFWAPLVFVIVLLFILAMVLFVRRNGGGEDVYDRAYLVVLGVLGVVLLFTYTNKVFSTQYLLWFLPWILVLGAFRSLQEEVFLTVAFTACVYLSRYTGSDLFSTLFLVRALILAAVIAYVLELVLRDGYPDREESFLMSFLRLTASRRPRFRRCT